MRIVTLHVLMATFSISLWSCGKTGVDDQKSAVSDSTTSSSSHTESTQDQPSLDQNADLQPDPKNAGFIPRAFDEVREFKYMSDIPQAELEKSFKTLSLSFGSAARVVSFASVFEEISSRDDVTKVSDASFKEKEITVEVLESVVPAPEKIASEVVYSAIIVMWTPVRNARYHIYTTKGDEKITRESKSNLVTDWEKNYLVLYPATPDVKHNFAVSYELPEGIGALSATTSQTPTEPPPPPLTDVLHFEATRQGDHVVLNWEESFNATKYHVFFDDQKDVDETDNKIIIDKPPYIHRNVGQGEKFYRIRAVNSLEEGPLGTEVESASTMNAALACSATDPDFEHLGDGSRLYDKLALHYDFEEQNTKSVYNTWDYFDRSGNGWHGKLTTYGGTLYGQLASVSSDTGASSRSGKFNGRQVIGVESFEENPHRSYAFWLKADTINSQQVVISRGGDWRFVIYNGQFFFQEATGTNHVVQHVTKQIAVPKTISKAGTWHHVALVFHDDRVKLYFNGGYCGQQNSSLGNSERNADLTIGGHHHDINVLKTQQYISTSYQGNIDNFSIWDRPLTAVDVLHLAKQHSITNYYHERTNSGYKVLRSCKQIKQFDPDADDDHYLIDRDGLGPNQPFEIWCHDMNSDPQEFLYLPYHDGDYNRVRVSSPTTQTQYFDRVSLNPISLGVDTYDLRYQQKKYSNPRRYGVSSVGGRFSIGYAQSSVLFDSTPFSIRTKFSNIYGGYYYGYNAKTRSYFSVPTCPMVYGIEAQPKTTGGCFYLGRYDQGSDNNGNFKRFFSIIALGDEYHGPVIRNGS